jgi:hypothetical protein
VFVLFFLILWKCFLETALAASQPAGLSLETSRRSVPPESSEKSFRVNNRQVGGFPPRRPREAVLSGKSQDAGTYPHLLNGHTVPSARISVPGRMHVCALAPTIYSV